MIHVGLGNFVWCNECEIDNLCLASDKEDFGKDSGAVSEYIGLRTILILNFVLYLKSRLA